MAISRASADDLVTEVRRLVGQVDTALSTDLPNVRILDLLNRYIQGLTHKVSSFLKGEGKQIADGTLKLSFWKQTWASTTVAAADTLVVTQSGSTVDFPDTFDYLESLYDETNNRVLESVREVNRRHTMGRRLRDRAAGPPEAYELLGWATSGSLWVKQTTLYPPTETGITPSLTLTGYRKPAILTSQSSPSASEFLDIDPEYDQLAILGTVVSILSAGDPMVEEFKAQEQDMIGQLAMTAVQVS